MKKFLFYFSNNKVKCNLDIRIFCGKENTYLQKPRSTSLLINIVYTQTFNQQMPFMI